MFRNMLITLAVASLSGCLSQHYVPDVDTVLRNSPKIEVLAKEKLSACNNPEDIEKYFFGWNPLTRPDTIENWKEIFAMGDASSPTWSYTEIARLEIAQRNRDDVAAMKTLRSLACGMGGDALIDLRRDPMIDSPKFGARILGFRYLATVVRKTFRTDNAQRAGIRPNGRPETPVNKSWVEMVRQKIRSYAVFPPRTPQHLTVEYSVTQSPEGEVLEVKLLTASGFAAFDNAIKRAILRSSPLPKAATPSEFVRELHIRYVSSDGADGQPQTYGGVMIQDVTKELAATYGLTGNAGILVSSIDVGGPESMIGLDRGDVVLKVGTQPVDTTTEFVRLVRAACPRETIPMEVWREGAIKTVPVTVARRPASAASVPAFEAADRSNPPPMYPAESRRAGEQGKTDLRVLVDAQGLPKVVEIHQSSGFPRLDQAAIDAIRMWKYVPACRVDQPVEAWVIVPVIFRLKDDRTPVESLNRRIDGLEAQPDVPPSPPKPSPATAGLTEESVARTGNTKELPNQAKAMVRLGTENHDTRNDNSKRPRKKFLGSRSDEYRFAKYIEDWRKRIEQVGTENYPAAARGKLYGSLVMTITIKADGSLAGPPEINRSSGHKILDDAALHIVQMASPYAPFPQEILRDTELIEMTRVWNFTKGDSFWPE